MVSLRDEDGRMTSAYQIKAIWDPDAKVYYSETNVPGLVVEAETLPEFVSIAEELLPEMLRANTTDAPTAGGRISSGNFSIAL